MLSKKNKRLRRLGKRNNGRKLTVFIFTSDGRELYTGEIPIDIFILRDFKFEVFNQYCEDDLWRVNESTRHKSCYHKQNLLISSWENLKPLRECFSHELRGSGSEKDLHARATASKESHPTKKRK